MSVTEPGWTAQVEAVLRAQAPVGTDLLAVLLDRPRHEVVPRLDRHPLIYLDGNRRWSIAKAGRLRKDPSDSLRV